MNPKLGLVSFSQNDSSQQFYKPYSDATGELIDTEAKLIIDAQYLRVKELLNQKKDLVTAMADELLKEDTLVYNQLVGILGERPHGIKDSYAQFVTASGNPFTDGMQPETVAAETDKEAVQKDGSDSQIPPTEATSAGNKAADAAP